MEIIFIILFKHTWIFFILITILNGVILRNKSKRFISEKPELKEGYDRYFKGFLFYGNICWLIMAYGNLSGMTSNTFEYFNPKSMNPIVLLFHASIIILWILGIRWIYFKNGAEFIEQHPGLFFKSSFKGSSNMTARDVKIFYPIMVIGGIIGMVMMWNWDMQFPNF